MSAAVEQTSTRVEECLQAGLSGVFTRHDETSFFAKRGSAVVGIRVLPWEDSDAMVHIEAGVVEGATLSEDILRQLLEFNNDTAYGAFGVSPDGVITIHHCLLGSTLQQEELMLAVVEVAKIADDWDDVIIEQGGGKRAVDRLREKREPKAQPTIEPPKPEE